MKSFFRKYYNKFLKRIEIILQTEINNSEQRIKGYISTEIQKLKDQHSSEIQCLLKNQYLVFKNSGNPKLLPALENTGFQVYSQYEEDGLLLYIFSMIGTTNKKVVEMCAGDGTECMASNLIINHGWQGLLFDGDKQNVVRGKKFFSSHKSTFLIPPKFINAWITTENINRLVEENEFGGEIDLLSMDMDGNDYWFLKKLDVVLPRVIICEVQDIIPADLSITIPYQPDFYYHNLPEGIRDFRSASLLAMKTLCKQKGYRLIGAHKYGFNVIFMRDGIGEKYFPEVSIKSVQDNPWTREGQKTRWPKVQHMEWQEV